MYVFEFRKACNSISHSILLRKLHVYGVRDMPNYLTGRKQYIQIGNVSSSMKDLNKRYLRKGFALVHSYI